MNFKRKWTFLQLVNKIKYNSASFVVKYLSFDSLRPEIFSDWKAVPMSTRYKTVDKSSGISLLPNNELRFGFWAVMYCSDFL